MIQLIEAFIEKATPINIVLFFIVLSLSGITGVMLRYILTRLKDLEEQRNDLVEKSFSLAVETNKSGLLNSKALESVSRELREIRDAINISLKVTHKVARVIEKPEEET
jgi:hypothetical protein